jgi:trigger factor
MMRSGVSAGDLRYGQAAGGYVCFGRERNGVNVTVEHLGPCKKLLRVELEPQDVEQERDAVIREVLRHARLPGFRPGKAPRQVVVRAFGTQIEGELRRKLIPEAYRKAIDQQKLRPIVAPDIEEGLAEPGKPIAFTATLETEPDFELPDYRNLPLRRDARAVTEEDVERALATIREERAKFADLARPVQNGDYVVVNYTGTCEGKPLSDWSPAARGLAQQKNFWLHVESGQFIPGFTDQLLGASAGEQRTVTVSFAPDFVAKELAGKTGVYAVEVVRVKERIRPAVDDALALAVGAANLQELKATLRQELNQELERKKKRQVRDQLVATLLGRVSCELPEDLVQHETRNVVYDIVRSNQERGVTKAAIDERREEIYTVASNSARERVKAMLVLRRIAENEKLQVTKEELAERIKQLADRHQIKPDKLARQLQERGALGQVQQDILEAKTLDVLELYAKVEEGPDPTV